MVKPDFETKIEKQTQDYARFEISPLPASFGHSMGLALRRTLLSSVPGAAVVEVEIKGVTHPFSTIKGVKESVLDILLNLKKLFIKLKGEDSVILRLEAKGKGKVLAKDLKGEAEIVNGDEVIATLTDDKSKLTLTAKVEQGIGHRFVDDIRDKKYGVLYLDAFFSPIRKVNFKVEEARKGRRTDFDKLILEVWTNGSITPKEAVVYARNVLSEHFAYLLSGEDAPKKAPEKTVEEIKKEEELKRMQNIIIDELNLPSRIINALLREKIETVADLVKFGKSKLEGMKGLGKKSIDLIEDELRKLGFDWN